MAASVPGWNLAARGAHSALGGATMPNEYEISPSAIGGQTAVWLVLASDRPEGGVAAFWERTDAAGHAARLNAANPREGAVVREVVVQGSRRRCRLCGEPVVLDDPSDPMSWIHTEDANDFGDHTAEA
jgi:hypothetical protein